MLRSELQDIVLTVLQDIQVLGGRPWLGLNPHALPIGELEGFDSLTSIEATVMIEQKLGGRSFEIPTLFVSEDGKRALSIAEVVDRLATVTKGGAKP